MRKYSRLLPLPSIGIDPTEHHELLEVLQRCKNRKHPGADKIVIEMIKICIY
jgi:hypothetical protein